MDPLLLLLCFGFAAVTIALLGCVYFLQQCAIELVNLRLATVRQASAARQPHTTTPT